MQQKQNSTIVRTECHADKMKGLRSNRYLLSYILLLFFTWSVVELYVIPNSEYFRPFYKVLIWVMPVLLYIRLVDKNDPIYYLNLANKIDRIGWLFIITSVTILASNSLRSYIYEGSMDFNLDIPHLINAVLLAGITEEIVFRGFIFKKLSEKLGYWSSNTLQSILFASIHIPIWISNNQDITILFLYVFSFGLAMGYFAKKSKSLWTLVIIHSLHNLLI